MPSVKSTRSEEKNHVESLQLSGSHGQVDGTSTGDGTATSTEMRETMPYVCFSADGGSPVR